MKSDLFSGNFELITNCINVLDSLGRSLYHELNIKNEVRYTPLHCAIFSRNYDAVAVLVQNGADVNTKCFGTPCIHLALTIAMLPDGYEFGLNCFNLFLEHIDNLTDKVIKLFNLLYITLILIIFQFI
jgi:ankyrin repeat protein